MKVLKKILPYRVKAMVLPLLGAGLMATSCNKEEKRSHEPIVKRNIEIEFDRYIDLERFDNSIKNGLANPAVDTIFLKCVGSWSNYSDRSISNVRNVMEPRIKMAEPGRIRGKGDFNFMSGEASLVPEDSLWIVSQGWTINQIQR